MKTMSVYGLLGKIYNYNDDLPKRILFRDRIYELDDYNHYVYKEINNPFIPYIDLFAETLNWELDDFLHEQIAIIENDEVEILEEPKGIPEKLDHLIGYDIRQFDDLKEYVEITTGDLFGKVNKIIDTLNQLLDYLESKGE